MAAHASASPRWASDTSQESASKCSRAKPIASRADLSAASFRPCSASTNASNPRLPTKPLLESGASGLSIACAAIRRDSSRSPAKNSACDSVASAPTLRTSAPARAAATARRACSAAAPTSPRSITSARVSSTTASTYGDHACGRSRRERSDTASSRRTSISGRASSPAAAAPAAGSSGCSISSSGGSRRTQPRNCPTRPPLMN